MSNSPPERVRSILAAIVSRPLCKLRELKFFAARDGATAVEFAIVGPLFFLILLAMLDGALFFATNVSLDLATSLFAKQIRTGQIQAPGSSSTTSAGVQLSLSDAKVWICRKMAIVGTSICTSQLQIDVRPISSFSQTGGASPVSGSQFKSTGMCYYSGIAGDVVQIRIFYLYSFFDPLLIATFTAINSYQGSGGSASGNYFPVSATQVFKSEYYSGNTNTGAGC